MYRQHRREEQRKCDGGRNAGRHGSKTSRKKNEKKKKRKTMDDIFLKQHPWENQHDLYLQLQNERVKLAKRCQLYTVGIDHIVLRIFFLILFAWLTYILIFFIAIHHSDIAAYFIGTVTCVELPYEISRVFKNYHQGQLWKKIKKLLIRLFVLVFLPLTFGYGWMLMVFHFTHSMLETPLLPFAEMYCTGIYITTVYLLLQDQEKVQEIIRWIQGHMDIDLWRFWDEMAKHIVQLIIIHLSFPIALRYLLLHFVILPRQAVFPLSSTTGDTFPTHTIDIQYNNKKKKKESQYPFNVTWSFHRVHDHHPQNASLYYYRRWNGNISLNADDMHQFSLDIDSIINGDVSLHYNLHEYELFLHHSPIHNLLRMVFSGDISNTLIWFEDPHHVKLWVTFVKFLCELLILRCPIVTLLWFRLNYKLKCVIVAKLPAIKEQILIQKLFFYFFLSLLFLLFF
ncbi:hypothetical protein RFI_25482 [Reticulomyxa filosa]|uniref:Transmembrane protein n=1 Tax=Reticulomyxa filosa TaxID=46433 RepID=X6MDF8_RETFI|nr:hypothetical protein RFI_25482 [Reticulomyxa filosa]|eukprot:ETO11894.1 hypothetical protein RFI_25482 [Reticulomyxa filosa]